MLSLLLLVCIAAPLSSAQGNGTVIASPPADYPRATTITTPGGAVAVATVERPTAVLPHRIALLRRTSASPETWVDSATVQGDVRPHVDLANGFVFQFPAAAPPLEVGVGTSSPGPGALLCAYRLHTDEGTPYAVYTIGVSWSGDYGASWAPLSNISVGAVGVWEPFLFRHSSDPAGTVRALTSAELTNGGEQDIVHQVSDDYGVTWGAVSSRIHTPGSRNGMPGAVELPDASILVLFEGFWTGLWGSFTVNSARSFDAGGTWVQRQVVHAPAVLTTCNGPLVPCCAGSPQVGVCAGPDGTLTLAAVFMSNEGHPGSVAGGPFAWPAHAGVGVVLGALDASNASSPVTWGGLAFAPLVSPYAFWPSVFLDAAATAASPAPSVLRLAYQTDADSAALSAGAAGGGRGLQAWPRGHPLRARPPPQRVRPPSQPAP